VPAKIVYAPGVELPFTATIPNNAEVVLKLNVGEDGQARDIEVVRSESTSLNAPVIEAVRKFRFRPATLDKQAIEVPLNLTVTVQR
jgi:TonB family protein